MLLMQLSAAMNLIKMRSFNCSCQGASHIVDNKECQDYSVSYQDADLGLTVAIVSDGHGGATYFRSAEGAKTACEVTLRAIREFVEETDQSLFMGKPLLQEGVQASLEKESTLGNAMRHLFASIYAQWRIRITEDATRPLADWEKEHVSEEYQQLLLDSDKIEKVYGCTLMTYVCTSTYWFAFHIGDGKCVMVDEQGTCSQPIPWDEKCFLNKTTSLCDSEPIGEFRFCARGDGEFPVAVFLGSDGIDDSFGEDDKLHGFYTSILRQIINEGEAKVTQSLAKDLKQYSERGSKDDMSIACVYNETKLLQLSEILTEKTISRLQNTLATLKATMDERKSKLTEAENRCRLMEREYSYAKQQYENTLERIEMLQGQMPKEKPSRWQQILKKYAPASLFR